MNMERIIEKLNALYPEHKIFALSALDDDLREALASSYKEYGYATLDELLCEHGFEIISGDEVRKLRPFVLYTPGNEPAVIENKISSILNRLEQYYPDHEINGSIQSEHKQLYTNLSGLYRWLGYEDIGSMLEAYGYRYSPGKSGRPENDFDAIIVSLMKKYENAPKPKNLSYLIFDNPDLRGQLKTMSNKAPELYGMSLKQFFEELGLFAAKGETAVVSKGKNAPVGGKMAEAAINALKVIYQSGAQGEYGTVEELEEALGCLTVKQNKQNKIYVNQIIGSPEHLKVPYGVNLLSDSAFAGCKGLTKVVLPETLEEIGKSAFSGCPDLREVNFPKSLLSIGKRAFADCPKLSAPDLSECLAKYPDDAFDSQLIDSIQEQTANVEDTGFDYTVEKLRSITITGYHGSDSVLRIPEKIMNLPVTAIAREAFVGCTSITEADMPDTIVNMGAQVFVNCTNLRRVHLSDGITRLYTNAFNGCTSLTEINIPDAITELKRNTFSDSPIEVLHIGKGLSVFQVETLKGTEWSDSGYVSGRGRLKSLTVSSDSPYFCAEGTMLLSKDRKNVIAELGIERQIVIPEGIERIEGKAFANLRDLSDVTLPESLRVIGSDAFEFTALRSVSFPASLRRIESEAFSYCEKLSAVLFSEGIEYIGSRAFYGCPIASLYLPASLTDIEDDALPFLDDYWNNTLKRLEIDERNPRYKAEDNTFYQIEPEGLVLKALIDKEDTVVRVADGTVRIDNRAFRGMSVLKKVTLPSSLREIGEEAFRDCMELDDIRLPDGLQSIGARAFIGTRAEHFVLPAGIKEIGEGAFTGCELKLEEENRSFLQDKNMLYAKLEDGTLRALAFSGSAERLLLRENTSEIGAYAFSSADLEELYIPASLRTIQEHAFDGCMKLRHLYIEQKDTGRWAAVYLPGEDMGLFIFYDSTGMRRQMIDCIRFSGTGDLFDYIKYDSLFELITDDEDRIMIAIDRLKTSVDLQSVYQQSYERFLCENADDAIQAAIRSDDVPGCHLLCNLDIISGQNIINLIALASESGSSNVSAFLLDYQNTKELNPDPMAEFTLDW